MNTSLLIYYMVLLIIGCVLLLAAMIAAAIISATRTIHRIEKRYYADAVQRRREWVAYLAELRDAEQKLRNEMRRDLT